MTADQSVCLYTKNEERLNTITHGIGALLSLVGLIVLVTLSASKGHGRSVASFTLYGLTLVILYSASLIYHSAAAGRYKRILQVVDHASIYLLIAGSYTPVTLLVLQGALGWSLFGIIWLLACLGIGLNLFCFKKTKPITFALYFIMGWLVVVAVKPLMRAAEPGFLLLLLGGGLCYTLGIVFYAMKKIPFHHGIWHLFVLSGSICHFLGFLFYLT